jgi:predicted DNA-binding transcriptional regulator AlpA
MNDPPKTPFDPFFDRIREIIREEIAKAVKGSKDDRLLTVEEVCQVLNVTEAWVYHNTKQRRPGDLTGPQGVLAPFVRKVGGNLRFSNNDLQRWIAAQKFQDTKLRKLGG